jgi:hypothetical protein
MMSPGRPRKEPEIFPLPRAEQTISNITSFVDKVISRLYRLVVPQGFDIAEQMKQRLMHEGKRIQVIRDEMKKLAESYNRYVDLQNEWNRREKRIRRIAAVLVEDSGQLMIPAKHLREELPLWEAMKEYLQYVPEARIAELEAFFEGVMTMDNANRQAIESALKRHPEAFKTRKNKREKFISLRDSAKDD